MRINYGNNLEAKLAYLGRVLPPIEYSLDGETNTISINEVIGNKYTTVSDDTEDNKRFHEFLYNKGYLIAFINNVLALKYSDDVTNGVPRILYFSNAFPWDRTSQGSGLWVTLERAWAHEITHN